MKTRLYLILASLGARVLLIIPSFIRVCTPHNVFFFFFGEIGMNVEKRAVNWGKGGETILPASYILFCFVKVMGTK